MANSRVPKDVINFRRSPQKGDRVTFTADVLRVFHGEEPQLLLMTPRGEKLRLAPHWLPNGEKVKGGDKVHVTRTVTRVGEGTLENGAPVSMAVDGYLQSRVTIPFEYLDRGE